MASKLRQPTNLRQQRRKTERALAIAVVIMLVIVGSVVIGLVYGWASVLTGLICLLPGAGVFVLLWGLLNVLEFLARDKDL